MWRFLGTAPPPAKRKKLDETEKAEAKKQRDRQYDAKERERGYSKTWESTFTWVQFDPAKKHMFCRPCRRFPGLAGADSAWVANGSTKWRQNNTE